MIPQLAARLLDPPAAGIAPISGYPPPAAALRTPFASEAAEALFQADQLDLVLYMEQVWDAADVWGSGTPLAGRARTTLVNAGAFAGYPPLPGFSWDHLIASFVLENTRMVQIMRRVVAEFRRGERLGIPSLATQRWLDITETLVFGAAFPIPAWLSTSRVRPDSEAVRRNAYWRMFGMDLAFGAEEDEPFEYDKAVAANTGFVPLFEDLLRQLWQALVSVELGSEVSASDQDRIFATTTELKGMLGARRRSGQLAREELAAATALGWLNLTLATNSPAVDDLSATATSPGDRLRVIGARVGLAPHSKTPALIAMADGLSRLLRTLESDLISGREATVVLYTDAMMPDRTGQPVGPISRRVITEWSAATGKDLKTVG